MSRRNAPDHSSSNTIEPKASPSTRSIAPLSATRGLLQRAQADPRSLTHTDIQQLQRTIGNRATGRLLSQRLSIQTKLQVGPANDKYEEEADRTAQQVMRSLTAPALPMQREEREEGMLQAKPLSGSISSVQRSQLPAPSRTFVAPKTRRQDVQRNKMDQELAQAKPLAATISTVHGSEGMFAGHAVVKPKVQRNEIDEELAQASPSHGLEGGDVEARVAQSIQRAKGGGNALDPKTQNDMEGAFGTSFGGVRIHTGSQPDALNRSLNARAFTTGNDIFFRSGEYNPGSSGGKELLAHELTHTVQQGATLGIQRKFDMNFQSRVGAFAGTFRTHDRAFQAIMNAYTAYVATRDDSEEEYSSLMTMIGLCDSYTANHSAKNARKTQEVDALRKKSVDELESKKNDPTKGSDIATDYTHVDVYSEGAQLEDGGAFANASLTEYNDLKRTRERQNLPTGEIDVRIAMLAPKIDAAYQQMTKEQAKLTQEEDTDARALGVFTAPEWYFKNPGTPFSRADKERIIAHFQGLSAAYPGLTIIPGTIMWVEGRDAETTLYNTVAVFMNGKLLKESHKAANGGDTAGYFGSRGQPTKSQVEGQYARSGERTPDYKGVPSPAMKDDSSHFKVGGLNLSIEICADHGNARARQDILNQNSAPRTGVDVQILVSHGAMYQKRSDMRKPGGIFIANDASMNEEERSVRGTAKGETSPGLKMVDVRRGKAKADMHMGIFKLPQASGSKEDRAIGILTEFLGGLKKQRTLFEKSVEQTQKVLPVQEARLQASRQSNNNEEITKTECEIMHSKEIINDRKPAVMFMEKYIKRIETVLGILNDGDGGTASPTVETAEDLDPSLRTDDHSPLSLKPEAFGTGVAIMSKFLAEYNKTLGGNAKDELVWQEAKLQQLEMQEIVETILLVSQGNSMS